MGKGVKLLLPNDNLVVEKLDFANKTVSPGKHIDPDADIEDGWEGVDIGPETIKRFSEERRAVVHLLRSRLIVRRSASVNGCYEAIGQHQSVISPLVSGLVREACPVQRSIEPLAAAIPGKHAASSVRPVRGWS